MEVGTGSILQAIVGENLFKIGKPAQPGEIRTWSDGQRYQRTIRPGVWKRLSDGKIVRRNEDAKGQKKGWQKEAEKATKGESLMPKISAQTLINEPPSFIGKSDKWNEVVRRVSKGNGGQASYGECVAEYTKDLQNTLQELTQEKDYFSMKDEDRMKVLKEHFESMSFEDQYGGYGRAISGLSNTGNTGNVKDYNDLFNKTGLTQDEFSKLTGGQKVLAVDCYNDESGFSLKVTTDTAVFSRTLEQIDEKTNNLRMDYMYMRDSRQQLGIGLKMFQDLVDVSRNLGCTSIRCTATRLPKNGYYTWARVGFEDYLGNADQHIASFGEDAPAKSLKDLMSTPEGRQWWKINGEAFEGNFELKEGSDSLKMLKRYQQECKLGLKKSDLNKHTQLSDAEEYFDGSMKRSFPIESPSVSSSGETPSQTTENTEQPQSPLSREEWAEKYGPKNTDTSKPGFFNDFAQASRDFHEWNTYYGRYNRYARPTISMPDSVSVVEPDKSGEGNKSMTDDEVRAYYNEISDSVEREKAANPSPQSSYRYNTRPYRNPGFTRYVWSSNPVKNEYFKKLKSQEYDKVIEEKRAQNIAEGRKDVRVRYDREGKGGTYHRLAEERAVNRIRAEIKDWQKKHSGEPLPAHLSDNPTENVSGNETGKPPRRNVFRRLFKAEFNTETEGQDEEPSEVFYGFYEPDTDTVWNVPVQPDYYDEGEEEEKYEIDPDTTEEELVDLIFNEESEEKEGELKKSANDGYPGEIRVWDDGHRHQRTERPGVWRDLDARNFVTTEGKKIKEKKHDLKKPRKHAVGEEETGRPRKQIDSKIWSDVKLRLQTDPNYRKKYGEDAIKAYSDKVWGLKQFSKLPIKALPYYKFRALEDYLKPKLGNDEGMCGWVNEGILDYNIGDDPKEYIELLNKDLEALVHYEGVCSRYVERDIKENSVFKPGAKVSNLQFMTAVKDHYEKEIRDSFGDTATTKFTIVSKKGKDLYESEISFDASAGEVLFPNNLEFKVYAHKEITEEVLSHQSTFDHIILVDADFAGDPEQWIRDKDKE